MNVPLFETVHASPGDRRVYPGWLGYNALTFFGVGTSLGARIDVSSWDKGRISPVYLFAKYIADDEYLVTVAGFYTFAVVLPVRLDELAMSISAGFEIFVTEKTLFNLLMKAKDIEENPF